MELQYTCMVCTVKADREGGMPLELSVEKVNVNGFTSKHVVGENYFVAPCLYYAYFSPSARATNSKMSSEVVLPPMPPNKESMLIFLSVPVSPGYSRVIFAAPRNYDVWRDRIVPRWIGHMIPNLILDSDILLLHLEERKVKDVNWQKACYVPTKSDALVVAFRKWLNKYGGTQFDWRGKYSSGELPPTPPRDQLFDRYWTHTVGCSSCNMAYKRLNALQFGLQLISIASTAVVAAAKKGAISIAARYSLASMAVLCFLASKWLSHFIYKNFHCHDYDHAFR